MEKSVYPSSRRSISLLRKDLLDLSGLLAAVIKDGRAVEEIAAAFPVDDQAAIAAAAETVAVLIAAEIAVDAAALRLKATSLQPLRIKCPAF
jgi:hypothetical protein